MLILLMSSLLRAETPQAHWKRSLGFCQLPALPKESGVARNPADGREEGSDFAVERSQALSCHTHLHISIHKSRVVTSTALSINIHVRKGERTLRGK